MLMRYLFLTLAACVSLSALAADDSARFVDALRSQGMHDVALDYLNDAESDRLATDAFKNRIPYERGVTLLAKWRQTSSSAERARLIDQIKSELEAYAEANEGSAQAIDAQQQLATLLMEMATRSLTQLENRAAGSEDSQEAQAARRQLGEARELFTGLESLIEKQLDTYPKVLDPKTQADKIDERRELRSRLAQVRVLRSQALLEEAKTFDKDSQRFTRMHEQAAEELQALYDKYGSYIVGFYARVYQGECYLALGKLKEASGCFEDIIVQGGENPAVRPLVTKALALQAEILLKEGQIDTLLAKQGRWLESMRPSEGSTADWQALGFHVAEAKRKKAADRGTKDGDTRRLRNDARELYTALARRPGSYQDEARKILASDFDDAAAGEERREVNTFDEALLAAKESITMMTAAQRMLPTARKNNQGGVASLESQAESGFANALYYLETARSLVDDDTPVDQLNEVRWLSCWLLWQDERYYRSAVLADFLVRHYPEDPVAANAAQVAMASYEKLYQAAVASGADDGGKAEADQLRDLAGFVIRRWEGAALADTAFGVLLNFSIKDKDFAGALELVEKLPEDQRAVFEARIGNAMWEAQLRAASERDGSVDRESLRQQAVALLDRSFDRTANDPSAGDTLAAASLYLALARIDAGQYQQAIELLEDPKRGAIALSQTNNPIASRDAYATESYKAALRAYVSVVPPQTEKAVATMRKLEELLGEGGGDKLTRVYLSLGLQLQQQVEDLRAAGKLDEAKRVSEAFVAFLDRLNEQGSADPTVQQWIAQTYYRLAEGLEGDAAAQTVRSDYYAKAAASFKQIMEKQPENVEPGKMLALQVQYAETLRHAGKFAQAMQIFQAILAEKEMMIEAQTAAAYTLQEWGKEDASKWKEAIAGSGPLNDKGKPIVWGWSYLGKVAASVARSKPQLKQRFKELFYESWLNIASISMMRGDEKKARKIVEEMVRNYPDLLTMPVRDGYNDLMKTIQRAEGLGATGLEELVADE